MSCEQYTECKNRLFPDDPMRPVKYPSGRIATICHDCGRDNHMETLVKQSRVNPSIIKDLNTRIAVLEKQLEERPSYTSNESKSSF